MKCFICEEGQSSVMSEDKIPCKCGDVIVVEYHLCNDCGSLWKTIDGELIEGSLLSADNIDNMLDDIEGFIDEDLENAEKFTTLGGFIHKCLECGTLCYEIGENIYKCSNCGFEWEMIDCG